MPRIYQTLGLVRFRCLGAFVLKRYSIEDAKWCCGDLETTPWRAVISYLITLRLHVCIEGGGGCPNGSLHSQHLHLGFCS